MKLHANARTCPNSRRLMVERVGAGWSLAEAAEAAGVSDRTAAKWLSRWRGGGWGGEGVVGWGGGGLGGVGRSVVCAEAGAASDAGAARRGDRCVAQVADDRG